MKRGKKFLLVFLVLLVVSQVPFAYRRYKLGRLQSAIQLLNSQRVTETTSSEFVEYKGVVHVHSFLGGHSTGTFEEIIDAAKSNQLSFVIMTEHPSNNFDTAAMTLRGVHAGVLFINGNEISTSSGDRLLIFPGDEIASTASGSPTQDVIAQTKTKNSLAFVAYSEDFKSWQSNGYDGVEVYNVYTNARTINPVATFFDGLWSYGSYPDLLFATFYLRPGDNLRKWDEAIRSKNQRLVAIAGNDAHSNVGISLIDSSGKTLFGVKLDPYERSFRLVRVHILISKDKTLDSASLLAAISAGHCFIGFDLFGDASGFSFTASNGTQKAIQGDEIRLESEVSLSIKTPVSARVKLLKDGTTTQDESGIISKDFVITERGSYRVEVYLPQLPRPVSDQPWIISNPIYVR
jgi:hypothetical protein